MSETHKKEYDDIHINSPNGAEKCFNKMASLYQQLLSLR